jgi:hypothetical protein
MKPSFNRRRQQGSVLIAAIVCLAIIVAIICSMLVGALSATRQLRTERDLRQCELLLQAATERATHRLATERNYRGETWNVSAYKIIGAADGKATIEISSDRHATTQKLAIIAEYPAGSETSIRRSRIFSIPNKQTSAQE